MHKIDKLLNDKSVPSHQISVHSGLSVSRIEELRRKVTRVEDLDVIERIALVRTYDKVRRSLIRRLADISKSYLKEKHEMTDARRDVYVRRMLEMIDGHELYEPEVYRQKMDDELDVINQVVLDIILTGHTLNKDDVRRNDILKLHRLWMTQHDGNKEVGVHA